MEENKEAIPYVNFGREKKSSLTQSQLQKLILMRAKFKKFDYSSQSNLKDDHNPYSHYRPVSAAVHRSLSKPRSTNAQFLLQRLP
jgi:hypothetical protein